jgi:[ribosomal protein S5]-alanine N-acetyltransferase
MLQFAAPMRNFSLPILNANRVCLRGLVESDIDALFEIFSDDKVMRYWSTPPLPDRDAARSLFEEIALANARGSMMKWGIATLGDDTIIGTVTLFNLELSNGRAEIGYAQNRTRWGQGFMNEALQALLDYAFNQLNLRRLEADVDPRNVASIRTLERLGFQREGFLRERWYVNGEIQDAFFYGLLRREWRKPDISGPLNVKS